MIVELGIVNERKLLKRNKGVYICLGVCAEESMPREARIGRYAPLPLAYDMSGFFTKKYISIVVNFDLEIKKQM